MSTSKPRALSFGASTSARPCVRPGGLLLFTLIKSTSSATVESRGCWAGSERLDNTSALISSPQMRLDGGKLLWREGLGRTEDEENNRDIGRL